MPPLESIAESQAVLDSIRQIVHALQSGSSAAQKAVGLSAAQLFVLQTLAESEAMSVNELAAKSYTHQSSVSVVVSRLVNAKFVKRIRSEKDARRVELSVTPAGRRILDNKIVTPQQRLFEALNNLPAGRLAKLRELLQEVVSLSGMDARTPPMFLEGRTNRRKGRSAVTKTRK